MLSERDFRCISSGTFTFDKYLYKCWCLCHRKLHRHQCFLPDCELLSNSGRKEVDDQIWNCTNDLEEVPESGYYLLPLLVDGVLDSAVGRSWSCLGASSWRYIIWMRWMATFSTNFLHGQQPHSILERCTFHRLLPRGLDLLAGSSNVSIRSIPRKLLQYETKEMHLPLWHSPLCSDCSLDFVFSLLWFVSHFCSFAHVHFPTRHTNQTLVQDIEYGARLFVWCTLQHQAQNPTPLAPEASEDASSLPIDSSNSILYVFRLVDWLLSWPLNASSLVPLPLDCHHPTSLGVCHSLPPSRLGFS